MDSTIRELYVKFLAEWLVKKLEKEMSAKGPFRFRLDLGPEELALEVANELMKSLKENELRVGVMSSKSAAPLTYTSDDLAAMRNQMMSMFVFVHDSTLAGEGTFDNSFRSIEASELLLGALDTALDQFFNKFRFESEKTLREHVSNIGSHDGLMFVASAISSEKQNLWGEELWRIGLVPDLGPDAEFRLQRNIQATSKLRASGKAFETANRRLIDAKLAKGRLFDELELYLEKVPENFNSWLEGLLAKGLTFENWKFYEDKSGCVQSITLKPFRNKNGEVRRGLGFSSDENWLLADKGFIKVEWILDPPNVENLDGFRVEVLPVFYDDDSSQEPLFIVEKVMKSRRSFRVPIDSGDDKPDFSGESYFARVTAIDENGSPLSICADNDTEPELAKADSQEEFSIGLSSDEENRFESSWSLPEAKLMAFLNGEGNQISKVSYFQGDVAVFQVDAGKAYKVKSPELLRGVAQTERDGKIGAKYQLNSRTKIPDILRQSDIARKEFHLPEKFALARERLFNLLEENDEFLELVDYDDAIAKAVSEYVIAYEESLLSVSKKSDMYNLLTLDTIHLDFMGPHGKISGFVVLPTNPMMASWIFSLRRWTESVALRGENLNSRLRPRLFDLESFRQLQPRNVPFMIPFGHDLRDGVASYETELSHGYSLYLDSASENRQADRDLCKFILSIDSDRSVGKSVSKKLSDRLQEFVTSRDLTNTLNIRGVNIGDGKYLARSLNGILSDEFETRLNRISLSAYGRVGGFSNPLENLAILANSVNEAEPTSENFLTPRLRIRVATELPDEQIRERSDVTIVESSSTLSPGVGSPAPFSSSYLEDLILPSSFEAEPGEDGRMVNFCNPRPTTEISKAIKAHNEVLVKLGELGISEGSPIFSMEMEPKDKTALLKSHEDSSWVICVDESLNLDAYRRTISTPGRSFYIIDYSPEFIEGLTSRVFISTGDRPEMLRVLRRGVNDFDRDPTDESAEKILADVSRISPHMTMRLLRDDSLGSEVVGLAAAVKHMRNNRKSMSETILIPVDEHADLFNVSRNSGKRCDLILVSVDKGGGLELEFVEVKNHSNITNGLLESAASQITATESASTFLIQPQSPRRLDIDLQWARWASIVEFHAVRQYASGDLSEEAKNRILEKLDQPPSRTEDITITRSIFALDLKNTARDPKLENPEGVSVFIISRAQLAETGYFMDSGSDGIDEADEQKSKETSVRTDESRNHPSPSEVGTADEQEKQMLSTEVKKINVNLGESRNGDRVQWELSTQGAPHAVIAGKSGQGKSTLLRSMAGQLHAAGVPYLVLDYHGDFSTENLEGIVQIDLSAEALPLNPFYPGPVAERAGQRLSPSALQIRDILTSIYKLGERQGQVVYESVMALYKNAGWDDFSDGEELSMSKFKQFLSDAENRLRQTEVSSRLIEFTDFGIFSESSGSLNLANPKATIVDFSKGHGAHQNQSVRSSVASFIMRKLYQEMFSWNKDSSLKLAVLLDEAHLFKSDRTIPSLLREGRKFGLSVVQASQSLDDFSGESFQNQGLLMSFALGPKETQKSKTYLGVDKAKILALSPGEALVVRGADGPAELVRVWSE